MRHPRPRTTRPRRARRLPGSAISPCHRRRARPRRPGRRSRLRPDSARARAGRRSIAPSRNARRTRMAATLNAGQDVADQIFRRAPPGPPARNFRTARTLRRGAHAASSAETAPHRSVCQCRRIPRSNARRSRPVAELRAQAISRVAGAHQRHFIESQQAQQPMQAGHGGQRAPGGILEFGFDDLYRARAVQHATSVAAASQAVGPEPMMAMLPTGNADISPRDPPWRFEFCGSTPHPGECQFRD